MALSDDLDVRADCFGCGIVNEEALADERSERALNIREKLKALIVNQTELVVEVDD